MKCNIYLRHTCLLAVITSLVQIRETGSKICHSLDIRNNVKYLNKLENCSVVEGYVQIVLIERANELDFEPYVFPELREITDYLMLYRVRGLVSLGKLFPNLEIIRGNNPFVGYFTLVVHEMFSLTEIDLGSLREISKGSVVIYKNPKLCFVDTVDWDRITRRPSEVNYKAQNRKSNECRQNYPPCPQNCLENLCWSASHCQVDMQSTQCHPLCLGECHKPGPLGCYACRGFFNPIGECVTKCPPETYQFLNRRCVTQRECNLTPVEEKSSIHGLNEDPSSPTEHVIVENSCLPNCPSGYEFNSRSMECQKCREGGCKRECHGAQVKTMQDAQKLRGCTSINGSIDIVIKSDNSETVRNELEENLGAIEVIHGYLKVSRSSLIDLKFFKNLSTIGSINGSSKQFALIISENQNLQELWDWDTKENLTISGGKLFFHYNPKLCLQHIYKLTKVINYDADFTDLEISRASNGDQVPCHERKVEVVVTNRAHDYIQIHIPHIRDVFWYVLYYTKDQYKSVKMFDDLDQCSDFGWRTKDITVDNENMDLINRGFLVNLTDLEPDTQYAFYVTTYTINSIGATSDMKYAATLPTTPTELRGVYAFSNSSSTIIMQWEAPEKSNGKLSEYVITWAPLFEDNAYILQRNYCTSPMDYSDIEDEQVDEKPKQKITTKKCCKGLQKPEHDREKINQHCSSFFNDQFNEVLQNNQRLPFCEAYFYSHLQRYQHPLATRSNLFTEQTNKESVNTNINYKELQEMEVDGPFYRNKNMIITINRLPANSSHFIIDGLVHFQNYVVTIKACREPHPSENNKSEELRCSKSEVVTVRTQKSELADKITNNIRCNIKERSMYIYWDAPKNPNGLVVAFEIQYQRRDLGLGNPNPIPECITFTEYEHSNSGYSITGIALGRYEFRLRTVSLSGKGPFTTFMPFDIVDAKFSTVDIIFIIISLVVCVCLIILLLWYFARFKNPNTDVVFADVNPNYQYIPDKYEIDRKDVEFGCELGVGSFGKVFRGVLKPNNISCAIKTIGEESVEECRNDFLCEATVMKSMSQAHHIVQLLGVVSQGNPPLVVMELMDLGDLKCYLRSIRDTRVLGDGTMIQMASEIADAMTFMEAKKIIHRDLAARNCMVSSSLTVKIGDFGMARDIYETDYYRKKNKGLLPIRWMAPESLQDGEFTSHTDVWSFGVVLWELVTMAEQPYQGSSNNQVLQEVIAGRRLNIPNHCPTPLKTIMGVCWKNKASERHSFMQIMKTLQYYHDEEFRKVSYYYSSEVNAQRDSEGAYMEMKSVEDPLLNKDEI